MANIIQIKNTTVYRGRTKVFDALNLAIPSGRHTVILGPNGAGKSTLLKLITRELYPAADGGSVELFGSSAWNVWELRSHLGIVSQDLQNDYIGETPGRNVILSGLHASMDVWAHQHLGPGDAARADEIMRTLGIADLGARPFAAMSTGQQRRFLLGRALVNDPHTLILDEPTSGLDLKACFQYMEIVRELMRAGKTVIIVTHHIHEIPPETGHVILLKNGAVMIEGEKRQVLTSESLSALFDTPVQLAAVNGFFVAVPGR